MKAGTTRSPGLPVSALSLAVGGLAPAFSLPAPGDPIRGVPSEREGRVAVETGDLRGEVSVYRFPLVASMALGPNRLLFGVDDALLHVARWDG